MALGSLISGVAVNLKKYKEYGVEARNLLKKYEDILIGYIIDKENNFQLNPETAPFVLSAYQMYDDEKTMSEIAEDFNSKGLRNTRGTKFNINAISKILRNRRYIGEYKYREITIPDGIPAIVPKDLFERIQKQMQKNKKAPARYKAEADYILTTKLYCGKCMSFMVGESGTSRNSTTYRYYKCIDAKRNKGCDKKAVKKDRIEDLVINQIIKVLWDDELIDSLADMVIDLQGKENTTFFILTPNFLIIDISNQKSGHSIWHYVIDLIK